MSVPKRGRILIATLAAALLALLVWKSLRGSASGPVYQGKPLSYWLVQLEDSDSKVERDQAASAVRQIGTNAIPILLQMLRSTESPFTTKFLAWRQGYYNPFTIYIFYKPAGILARAEAGFYELGPSAASAVPELSNILDQNSSQEEYVSRISSVLGQIGPEAKASIPSLLRAAASSNRVDHFRAFDALGKIYADPDSVVPFLIRVISNAPADRMYAVSALGQFRGNAKSAVPALVALLRDPNLKTNTTSPHDSGFVSDRAQVERALEKIDPETYAWVVTNTAPASTR